MYIPDLDIDPMRAFYDYLASDFDEALVEATELAHSDRFRRFTEQNRELLFAHLVPEYSKQNNANVVNACRTAVEHSADIGVFLCSRSISQAIVDQLIPEGLLLEDLDRFIESFDSCRNAATLGLENPSYLDQQMEPGILVCKSMIAIIKHALNPFIELLENELIIPYTDIERCETKPVATSLGFVVNRFMEQLKYAQKAATLGFSIPNTLEAQS